MSDLLDLARRIVERSSGAEEVEAFLTHARNFTVKAFEGEVETLESAEPRGAGIRVLKNRRAGFSYTTDLSEEGLGPALEAARDNAAYASEDEALAFAPAWKEAPDDVPGLVDERQPDVDPEDKVAFALELERETRAADKRIRTVEEAVYADSDAEIAIASSTGVEGAYRETDAWCYSFAIATEGDDTEVGFDFDVGRGLLELNGPAIARRAAERAVGVLGAKKIASARRPVVFDPYTAAQFLGVLAQALTGEAVQKGRSLFAGRLGEVVAAADLSLVDDGRIPGAPGSSPWDGEGIATQRTEVIKGGVLTSYLYDLVSARRDGKRSTGNASRAGFKSAPGPAPSNLAFLPTGRSRSEVLVEAGEALLVESFHGVHSGANAVSGDFSVGATGRLLDEGQPGRPVKEVTIALPMLDILSSVTAVADDLRWLPFGGSFGGATTLIAEMTVAGE
jgi:PmbA protein